jgi:hypothetical protein
MAREFRILHHRQSLGGGHWDLAENPIPYRASTANAPQGDGTLCAALEQLGTDGWSPVMDLYHQQAQSNESFLLLSREPRK